MYFNKFIRSKNSIYEPKTYLYQYNDKDFRIVSCKAVRQKRLGVFDSQSVYRMQQKRTIPRQIVKKYNVFPYRGQKEI